MFALERVEQKQMKNLVRSNKASSQQGSSLLEVLIATVVLSIGLLGLAGLQTAALKVNQTASARSQAAFLTNDIFDRMRANRTEARDNGLYDVTLNENSAVIGNDVVANDLRAWAQGIASLPQGEVEICRTNDREKVTCTPSGPVTVTPSTVPVYVNVIVSWLGSDDANRGREMLRVTTRGRL